jgi:hypothetical protein
LEAAGVGCQVVEHAILQGITARGATIAVETEQFHRAVEVLTGIPARGCLLVRSAMTVGGEQDPAPARTPTRAPTGVVRRIFKWWYRQTGAEPGAIPPRATARRESVFGDSAGVGCADRLGTDLVVQPHDALRS